MASGFASSMSASDSVMWTIERDPELRSTIVAMCLLDRLPDMGALRSRIEMAADQLPRLHQRVGAAGRGSLTPRWSEAPDVDLEYHLREIAAPKRASDRWLLDFAAGLAEGGFDRTRPLWELVVVGGLPRGAAALLFKMHHSITDGVGGMILLAALLDDDIALPSAGSRPQPGPGLFGRVVTGVTDPVGTVVGGLRMAISVGRLVAPAGPQRSPILTARSTNWRFDTFDRPLAAFRAAASSAGGSINDVFLAGLTGGLGSYHEKHGRHVDTLRATIPVSIRRPGDQLGGNRFVPVRLELPVSVADPSERIRQTRTICRRWRNEPSLALTETIAGVLNLLPDPVTTAVMQSLLKGIDFVATNVPGMPGRCHLAGAEITRFYGFAPLTGAAINVALVSHAGTACIAVNSDRSAVPDPETLIDCLSDGIDEVLSLGQGAESPQEVSP